MSEPADARQIESEADGKRDWVAPEVRRMAAGSAEDGFNNIPDGGQPS